MGPAASTTIALRVTLSIALAITCLVTRSATAQSPDLPPEPELRQLVNRTMQRFNDAIQTKRFDRFRQSGVAGQMLRDATAKQMLEEFQPFIKNEIVLSGLRAGDIVFDETPVIGVDKVLRLVGFYPTEPMRVVFDLAYISEAGEWRLFGMTVGLKKFTGGAPGLPAGAQKVTGDKSHKALITKTLMDFNVAVNRKDFSAFHAKAATQMKRQMKPEQLLEVFRKFVDERVDISGVEKTEPHFDETPTVQNGLLLTLKGHYKLDPEFLLFDAEYFKEAGEWKILSLNVNTLTPGEMKTQRGTGAGGASDGDSSKESDTPKDEDVEKPVKVDAGGDAAPAEGDAPAEEMPEEKIKIQDLEGAGAGDGDMPKEQMEKMDK